MQNDGRVERELALGQTTWTSVHSPAHTDALSK